MQHMLTVTYDADDPNAPPTVLLSPSFLRASAIVQLDRLLATADGLMALADAINRTHAPIRCNHCATCEREH